MSIESLPEQPKEVLSGRALQISHALDEMLESSELDEGNLNLLTAYTSDAILAMDLDSLSLILERTCIPINVPSDSISDEKRGILTAVYYMAINAEERYMPEVTDAQSTWLQLAASGEHNEGYFVDHENDREELNEEERALYRMGYLGISRSAYFTQVTASPKGEARLEQDALAIEKRP